MTTNRLASPSPGHDALLTWLGREYGLAGHLEPLAGSGRNFLVTADDGRKHVLKVIDSDVPLASLECECAVIDRLQNAALGIDLPRCVRTTRDAVAAALPDAGERPLLARLLEFVPGVPWTDAGRPSGDRRRQLGRLLGALGNALDGFSHPAAARTHDWDLTAASIHRPKVPLVEDVVRRGLVERAFHLHASVRPVLPRLRRGVIHGDANDENLLVDGDRIVGLVDFGDTLLAPTVSELAIGLAYALLDEPDPLSAGADVVAGYHVERPLTDDEAFVLFPLVCGRLAVTVSMAAARHRTHPDHPTWFVTEDRAWRLLEALDGIDPATAARRLLGATDRDPYAAHGRTPEQLLERRERHVSRALSVAYREPLKMVRGCGQFLIDHRGRPFLDLVNNVCHVGHCHPRVVEAGQRQMARLNTNSRYLYDGLTDYAERLVRTLPAGLDVCFFVNSGSEANELALRLARAHTGRRDVLVVDGAYHGHTAGLIDISPYKFMGRGGSGQPQPWVHVVPMPDGYRGVHRGDDRKTGVAYGDDVGQVIARTDAPIAAFLVESLLSCGGQIVPPPGYLDAAFRHVRAAGGVCIADEVQTGFGRVGTHFWAFELQDVVPDIVVLGKPMGNGHPMGAVVTTRSIAQSFETGMEFFSTFGGNPVSCAIGLAVLDVIEEEGLQRHALAVGTRLRAGLKSLMADRPLIGDVRGEGLFIGVELVRDRATREPATAEATALVNRLRDRGVLLSTDGPDANVLKIKPPMVITADDVDMVVRMLDAELADRFTSAGPE